MTNCYFLTGTAENAIETDDGTATKVEEKDESAFSSGEVAWLLDKGQSPHQWVQMLGTEEFPRLVMEAGDEKYAVAQVTVHFPDPTTQEPKAFYTNIDQVLKDYPVMVGNIVYEFYEDNAYTSLINIEEKTYHSDTDIYAYTGTVITSIALQDMTLTVGDSDTLNVDVYPEDASYKDYILWESSNTEVATVDSSGKVTALKVGETTITATAIDGSGVQATCTVTVRKKSSGGSIFFWDLKFDTNGGSDINTLTEWEYSTIDLDDYVPEKEGYKFVGWYADEDLTKEIDEVYLTQDITVYAKWEKIEEEVPEEPEEVEEVEETETISFKDVKESDWFYEAVSYAVENGLMSGMSEDIFAPNTPLTREMLAVILWNLEGNPTPNDVAPFLDVTSDKYYANAIAWANENGIVAGYGDTFGVGDFITREQFAVMLYNYAQYQGYDVSVGEDTNILSYTDAFDISNYAYPAMQWACGAGIMSGNDDGTLNPQGKATRAEAATMLMNFCENVVK